MTGPTKRRRKYKKPLDRTCMIDGWKCPWCRTVHNGEPEWGLACDSAFHGEIVTCSTCGRLVDVRISPSFVAVPFEDDGEPF